MPTKLFGVSVLRRGDQTLLTGAGHFLNDIRLPEIVHVAIARSPHAHALLESIDADRARSTAGVLEVVSHRDLGSAGRPFPVLLPHRGLVPATWRALAAEKTRFVGEPVAAVVAEARQVAEDAVSEVSVHYHPLEPVVDVERALGEGSPLVHEQAPGNVAMHLIQRCGDADLAMREAPHRLTERFRISRGGGQPIETRGVVASYSPQTGELTVWSSTQEPHVVRDTIATVLGLPYQGIRVIAPHTGGGFGAKLNVYPEDVLIPWLALRLRRPVKWVEERREHLLAATQEREQIHDVEVGFDADGVILALKDRFLHDTGAYVPRGGAVPHITSAALPGPYRIPNLHCEMRAVYTNKVAVSAYRGAGQPQAVFVMERIMDRIAQHLGTDPAAVRLKNTIPTGSFPYNTGLSNLLGGPVEYDSGDFVGTLRRALEVADYQALRAEQQRMRRSGRLVGIGIASYVELSGRGPWEGAGVRVDPDGRVIVFTGAPSQGQGHETSLAQICADELGVQLDAVSVAGGDTALISHGVGTFASRVGVLAGNATREAARQVREKLLRIAGNLLEAHPTDLVMQDGQVSVLGVPGKAISLAAAARAALGAALPSPEPPGIEAVHYFKAPRMTYANGTHVAAVEVDADTGSVRIIGYVVAHDCGRMINPTIVEGQIYGGIACGIGNALLEENVYDGAGQLLSSTLMDYALPTATRVPNVEITHLESPSPLNPLGVKGVGEAGAIPVPAAICGAVEDALRPFGVKLSEVPLTQPRLWRAIARAAQSAPC